MATTPEKTVVYFCDTFIESGELPSDVVVGIVERHFEATRSLHATPGAGVQGFQSGVDWDALKEKQGAVAVIVHNTNDACVYGVSLEAQNAGLPTYELVTYGGNQAILRDCNNLQVVGALDVPVAGLTPL